MPATSSTWPRTPHHTSSHPDQVEWLDLLDLEIDYLRAAVRWASENDRTRALDTVAVLAPAAWLRGHRHEIRYVIERLLAQNSASRSLASCRALRWAAHLADASGWAEQAPAIATELALAQARSSAALALAEELEDASELAHCQRQHATTLVRLAVYAGDTAGLDEAEELTRRSEAGFHALGDAWGEAIAVVVSMFGALGAGDLPRTATLCDRAWPLVEAAGDRFLVERILFVRTLLAEVNGDAATAALLHSQALITCEELGFPEGMATHRTATPDGIPEQESVSSDEAYSMAASRAAGARAALAAGDLDRAESLFRAALAIYDTTGDTDARAGTIDGLEVIEQRRPTGARHEGAAGRR